LKDDVLKIRYTHSPFPPAKVVYPQDKSTHPTPLKMKSPTTSRRTFIKTGALALPLLASGCANLSTKKHSSDEFVRVRDGRFDLGGKPHFYVGANMWFGCYLSEASLAGGRQRLGRELDRLQSLGVSNIRLLAGSESSPLAGAISRGITRAPHDYDESILNGLDFCLAEMARRDMRAILYLSNFWQWSGGFAQYVRWSTGETIPDPDKPVVGAGNWHDFMQFSARAAPLRRRKHDGTRCSHFLRLGGFHRASYPRTGRESSRLHRQRGCLGQFAKTRRVRGITQNLGHRLPHGPCVGEKLGLDQSAAVVFPRI
jgi:hypothetical protein